MWCWAGSHLVWRVSACRKYVGCCSHAVASYCFTHAVQTYTLFQKYLVFYQEETRVTVLQEVQGCNVSRPVLVLLYTRQGFTRAFCFHEHTSNLRFQKQISPRTVHHGTLPALTSWRGTPPSRGPQGLRQACDRQIRHEGCC